MLIWESLISQSRNRGGVRIDAGQRGASWCPSVGFVAKVILENTMGNSCVTAIKRSEF